MTHDEKRFLRRDAINSHVWIIANNYGVWDTRHFSNLRLVVRLYECEFYGQELNLFTV